MSILPPVHTHIPLRSFAPAARSIVRSAGAIQKAELALSHAYPDHRCYLTSNGTSALAAAFCASIGGGIKGRVALPAYACPDVATAAIGAGFKILLYDVNPNTLAPDEQSVLNALHSGATHVLVAHWFGRIIDPGPIVALADSFGAVVIEDAAQHAGGTLNGKRAGGLTQWGVLSFGRGKGLNAGGGGALLVHHSVKLPVLNNTWTVPGASSSLRVLVAAFGTTLLSRPLLYGFIRQISLLHIGQTRFHEPLPISGITPVSSVLLNIVLDSERAELLIRRRHDAQYLRSFCTNSGVRSIAPRSGTVPGALRHPFVVSTAILEKAQSLFHLGVVRGYPRLLTEYQQMQQALVVRSNHFPGATELVAGLWTAPTHRYVHDSDIMTITNALRAGKAQ